MKGGKSAADQEIISGKRKQPADLKFSYDAALYRVLEVIYGLFYKSTVRF